MHIADGVITERAVLVGAWVLGGGGLALASRSFTRGTGEERAALVGVLGAFVFAAQMVNFPLPLLPVSAHLVGTGLLTLLLGPAAAIVVMSAVLLVQALLFQDGGVLAWGANVLNLAVVAALATAATLGAVPARLRSHGITAGAAGCASVLAASAACGTELVLGTGLDPAVVLGGLGAVQLLAAVAEGVITAVAFVQIRALVPLPHPAEAAPRPERPRRRLAILGAALMVAALGAFGASQRPDTLESFLHRAEAPEGEPVPAPIPDYRFPGVGAEGASRLLAGVAGVLATFGLVTLGAALIRRDGSGRESIAGPRAP